MKDSKEKYMLSAIIMASGYGKRMGQNKLLLKINNKTMIEHVIDKILLVPFSNIVLVAREKEVLRIGGDKGIRVIENKEAHKGQSESIKQGIRILGEQESFMFFTGDQPFIDEDSIKLLIHAHCKYKNKIIIPVYNKMRGTPVIFPSKFRGDLLKLEGDEGGRTIINNNKEEVIFIELKNKRALIDIDTLEEYKRALKRGEF